MIPATTIQLIDNRERRGQGLLSSLSLTTRTLCERKQFDAAAFVSYYHHKLSSIPAGFTRGSQAEGMEPKRGEASTAFGAPSGGVFVRLKASSRSSRFLV